MAEIEQWRERDAHDSYLEALAEIGRRVRAAEEAPRQGAHFRSSTGTKSVPNITIHPIVAGKS